MSVKQQSDQRVYKQSTSQRNLGRDAILLDLFVDESRTNEADEAAHGSSS